MPDHVERAAAFFPAYKSAGVEAVIPFFDPGVTWMAPPEWMDAPVYCGHEGLRDLDALWQSNFDEFGLEPEEVRAVGDRVVALMHMHGRIKGTGQEVNQRASWVVDFNEEGQVTRLCAYFSWEEALDLAARS